jgi:hypothetical protein
MKRETVFLIVSVVFGIQIGVVVVCLLVDLFQGGGKCCRSREFLIVWIFLMLAIRFGILASVRFIDSATILTTSLLAAWGSSQKFASECSPLVHYNVIAAAATTAFVPVSCLTLLGIQFCQNQRRKPVPETPGASV